MLIGIFFVIVYNIYKSGLARNRQYSNKGG